MWDEIAGKMTKFGAPKVFYSALNGGIVRGEGTAAGGSLLTGERIEADMARMPQARLATGSVDGRQVLQTPAMAIIMAENWRQAHHDGALPLSEAQLPKYKGPFV